jgi:hypothetical protein
MNFTGSLVENVSTFVTKNFPDATHKGIDYCNRVYTWLENSPIVADICWVWYQFLALIYELFDQQKSEYYTFMADWKKNDKKRLTENFYIDQSRPSFNYVNRHDFETFQNTFEKKQSLIKSILKLHPEYLEKEEMPLIQSKGICAGMVLDIGEKMVVDSQTIESLIPSIEDGGSLEAEIFQSLYMNTYKNLSYKLVKDEIIDMIQKSRSCESAPTLMKLLNVARSDIAKTLLTVIESQIIKYDLEKIRKISLDKERIKICQNDLFSFEEIGPDRTTEAISLLVYNTQQNRFPGPENWIEEDLIICSRLRHAMAREVDKIYNEKMAIATTERSNLIKRRTQLNAEIEMALFLLECKECDGTSNKKYLLLRNIFLKNENLRHLNLFANELFRINLIPMNHLIGNSLFLRNDDQILQNIDKLPEGYYYLALETKTSGHAIAVIKDKDGEWTIFDPNGGIQTRKIIRLCQSTINLLERLLEMADEKLKCLITLLNHANFALFTLDAQFKTLEATKDLTEDKEKDILEKTAETEKIALELEAEIKNNKSCLEEHQKELAARKIELSKLKKEYLIDSLNKYKNPIDRILPYSDQINHYIQFYKVEAVATKP